MQFLSILLVPILFFSFILFHLSLEKDGEKKAGWFGLQLALGCFSSFLFFPLSSLSSLSSSPWPCWVPWIMSVVAEDPYINHHVDETTHLGTYMFGILYGGDTLEKTIFFLLIYVYLLVVPCQVQTGT